MHRIDGDGHVGNLFSAGDETVKGTYVTAPWLNDLQENLMAVLAAAGISGTKGRSADLLDSINKLIAQGAGNDLADIAALRALTGAAANAVVVRVLDSDGSSNADYWFKDPNDESTADDGTTVIVDTDGNRWKKQLSGAWIPYATGETLESLKPAQAGADVTGDNTSANTLLVGTTAAAEIESGALVGSSLQTELDNNNFVTSIGDFVANSETSAENLQLSGLNVNNWDSNWTPDDRSVYFHIKMNRSTKTLTIKFAGHSGHSGTSNIKLELEVFGNTISNYSNINADTILSNKGSNIVYASDSNSYGPNGLVWTEGLTNTAEDIFTITLTNIISNTTSFRIRLVNFTTDDVSANRYIALGDTGILLNPITPATHFFSPDDTTNHDVLVMRNAPVDAGATNRKVFRRTTQPTNPADDLHEGDLWIDTNDENKLYHWDGSTWQEARDSGAQAGSDLVSNNETTLHQSSLGGIYGGDLVYGDDTSFENLKPSEAGAQVFTGKSITLLTDTTADNITSGSGSIQDIIDGLKLPNNGGFERGTAGSAEIPVGWFRTGGNATSRTEYYVDAPSDSVFGSQISYGAKSDTQNGGDVGWWRLGKKFRVGSTGDDMTVSARIWLNSSIVPASITRTPGSTCYYTSDDAYLTIAFYEADGTLISTTHSDSMSQQVYDNGNETLPLTISQEWVNDPLTLTVTVPANAFRTDVFLTACSANDAVSSLGLESGSGSVLFDDFTWSYDGEMDEVTEATWASEPGATHGATWGTDISGQPTDSDLLNAQQLWSDISGSNKPEDNATNRKVFSQNDAPVNPGDDINSGDLWIDTNDNNHLYRWSGSAWVSQRDGGITQALNDAATALSSTAAGSLTTYFQPTEPQGRADGDLWYDSSDTNKLHRFSFTTSQIVSGNDRYFSASLGNWTDTSAGAGGSISHDNVDEEMDIISNGVDYGQATLQLTVAAETEHEIKFDLTGGGNDCSVRVGTTSGGNQLLDSTFTTGTPKTERKYFSTGVGETTVYISIRNPASQTIVIDEFTTREEGSWQEIDDSRIATAIAAASTAQSTADGKIVTFFQSSAPTATADGDLWWDTVNKVLKRWDTSAWVTVSVTGTSELNDDANLKTNIFAQASEPTAGSVGDLWIDTDDGNKQYRWTGSTWANVRDTGIAAAQGTADGKIETYFQNDEPVSGSLGDLWFDTNDNNKMYRHDGTDWTTEVTDNRIGTLVTDVATAQSTADGKITTFFQESAPGSPADGDLWYKPSTEVTSRWNGSAWEVFTVTLTSNLTDDANLKTRIFRQDDAPANPADDISTGDLWIDTNDSNKLYWWDGNSWENSRDADIQNALDTANGKIDTYFQDGMPGGGSEGDLWFDTNDNRKLYRHNGTTFVETDDSRIATLVTDLTTVEGTLDNKVSTFFQSSAPTAIATGDLWYDTDDAKIRRWNGSNWVVVSTNSKIFVQPTEPSNPTDDLHTGDLWYDDDNGNLLSYWDGSDWIAIRDAQVDAALAAASTAQSTADGKITAFYQPAAPTTGMDLGDLWFDTDQGNRLYRYNGSDWTDEITDTRIAQAISDAATAQGTADSKVETFFTDNNTPPGSPSDGDLWYDSGTELLKRWDGSSWETVSNSYINTSNFVDDAGLGETALWNLVTGDDKPADGATNSKVFYGATEPANPADDIHDGDIWFDTSDDNRMHRWSGTEWIDVTDAGAVAGRDLVAALTAAGLNQDITDLVTTTNTASETVALASSNVDKWYEIYGGGGTRGVFLSLTIDKDPDSSTYKRVTVGFYSRNNHTGTGSLKFELEVFNNTIDSYSANTFQGAVTEKSAGLDFLETGQTYWGPNGLVSEQSITDAIDRTSFFTLADDPGTGTVFRLRVRELETSDSLGKAVVSLGNTPVLADYVAPYQFLFTPNDSTDQDVLVMRNAPAQAGATNSKTFVRDNAPARTADNLHDGDLWIDSNDGNKLYRWSDVLNGGTNEWIEVIDDGSAAGRDLTLALITEGVNENIASFVTDSTIAAEGYPSAANNVNDWESVFTTTDRSTILNIYFDKANKRLHVSQKGVNSFVNASSLDLTIEVFGNSIDSFTQGTKTTNITENPAGTSFDTQNEWGPNGLRWYETINGSEEKAGYFTLNETPTQTTNILIRVIDWTNNDVLSKKIIALGDTSVAVDPTGRLRFLTTISDGTDLDVLIMENAPSAAGADVTAPRAAVKINYSDYSQTNNGEAYLHGFGADGNGADVPAKILVGSTEISLSDVDDRSIYTSQGNTAGYIILDSTLSQKFDMDTINSKSIVFGIKANNTWYYDDNSEWISFTPAATDIIIGTLVTSGSDTIASADVWAYPMSLDVVSEAGATNSKVFSQDDAPADNILNNLHVGDIWIDTNDGNKLYRWDGSIWVDVQDSGATAGKDLIAALVDQGLNPDIANFVSDTNLATEYIPIASNNVLRWWESPYVETAQGTMFRIRINRTTKQVELHHVGTTGHVGTSTLDFELHIDGNTIDSVATSGVEDTLTEVGGGIDFATEDQWGPNGIRWKESITGTDSDTVTLTLTNVIGSATLFKLRIREHNVVSGASFLAFGSDLIASNYSTPSVIVFHANDSTSQDVLLMQNAPSQAGATNTKVIAQTDSPPQGADAAGNRYLNDGDLWIDTDDSNILRRWSDPDDDGTGVWQLVRDGGAVVGSELEDNLSNIGRTISDVIDVTQSEAAINVANWDGDMTPLGDGHRLHVRILKDSKQVTIGWKTIGTSTSLKTVKLEFEILAGNTIASFNSGTFSGTYNDSGTATFPWTQTEYGSNGVNIEESVSSGEKLCTITLTETITIDNLFRLKVVEIDDPATDEHNHLVYGDTPFKFDINAPVVNVFYPVDGTEYDVLAMKNAPAEAGATNTKTFYQNDAPVNPADDIHTGDFWIDSNDQNKLYRWDGSEWTAVRDEGAAVGDDLLSQITSLGIDASLASYVASTTDATKRIGYSLDNVNDWSSYFNLTTRATLLRTKIDKTSGKVYISLIGAAGHTGTSVVKGELEIVGDTLVSNSTTGMTSNTNGGDIDFDNESDRASNNVLWGSNGALFTANITNTNSVEFVLDTGTGAVANDVKFELRIREFTDSDVLAIAAVSFGDRINIIQEPDRPFNISFAVVDSSDYDVLLMQHAPAEAGADVTGDNTANDTDNVAGKPSTEVTQGSGNSFAHDFEVQEIDLWTTYVNEYTLTASTDVKFSGNQSAKFSTNAVDPNTITNFPFLNLSDGFSSQFSDEKIKITFWERRVDGETPTGDTVVNFFTNNNVLVAASSFTPSGTWTKRTVRIDHPIWNGGLSFIQINPDTSAAVGINSSVLIDRISIETVAKEGDLEATALSGAGALIQETVVSKSDSSTSVTIFNGSDPDVWKSLGASISLACTGDDPVVLEGDLGLNIAQINDVSAYSAQMFRSGDPSGWSGGSGWAFNSSYGGVWYGQGSGSPLYLTINGLTPGYTYSISIDMFGYSANFGTLTTTFSNMIQSIGSPNKSGDFHNNTTEPTKTITFLGYATSSQVVITFSPTTYYGMLEKVRVTRSYAGSGGGPLIPPQAGPGGPRVKWRVLRNSTSIYESEFLQVSGAGQFLSPILSVLDETPPEGINTYSIEMCWEKATYSAGVFSRYDVGTLETSVVIGSGTQWTSNISTGWTINGWAGVVAQIISDTMLIFDSHGNYGEGENSSYSMKAEHHSLQMTKISHSLKAIEYRNGG